MNMVEDHLKGGAEVGSGAALCIGANRKVLLGIVFYCLHA
jgi:hypothetical protein